MSTPMAGVSDRPRAGRALVIVDGGCRANDDGNATLLSQLGDLVGEQIRVNLTRVAWRANLVVGSDALR